MKLTKMETKELQAKFVEIFLKRKELEKELKSVAALLDGDFTANEMKYRNGVVTPLGILFRKPKWNFDVKPAIEAE